MTFKNVDDWQRFQKTTLKNLNTLRVTKQLFGVVGVNPSH